MLLQIWVYKYLGTLLSILLGIHPEGKLVDHIILFLNFWGNFYSVLHCCCTILHSHQQCTRVPISPHPRQHLLFSGSFGLFLFLIRVILMGVKWYLIVVLICTSLKIMDVEHFFHVFIGYSYIFFGEMFIQVLCSFLNCVVCFLLLSFINSLCILDIIPYQIYDLQIFSHIM